MCLEARNPKEPNLVFWSCLFAPRHFTHHWIETFTCKHYTWEVHIYKTVHFCLYSRCHVLTCQHTRPQAALLWHHITVLWCLEVCSAHEMHYDMTAATHKSIRVNVWLWPWLLYLSTADGSMWYRVETITRIQECSVLKDDPVGVKCPARITRHSDIQDSLCVTPIDMFYLCFAVVCVTAGSLQPCNG